LKYLNSFPAEERLRQVAVELCPPGLFRQNEMLKKGYVSAFALLALANAAYAQTTRPASPGAPVSPPVAGVSDGSGVSWLLPLIVLLVVGGLIWYFLKGRNRVSTSSGQADSGGTPSVRSSGLTGIAGTAGTTTGSSETSIRVYDEKK